MIRITFHKHTINRLVNRLKESGKYDSVEKNIEYRISEMDVVALRRVNDKKYMLVFEVKSSYNCGRKALIQLEKHKRTFEDRVDKVYKFYVTPKSFHNKKQYKIEWVRDGFKFPKVKLSQNILSRIKYEKAMGIEW